MERQEHIPDGYIFRPTDAELLGYLALFVTGNPVLSTVPIMESDLYNGEEPWKIFQRSRDKVLYIFATLKRRSSSDSRYIRTVGDGKGTWKAQDRGKPIYRYDDDDDDDDNQQSRQLIGYKRSLRYEKSGSKHDRRFLMKEYYFPSNIRATLKRPLNDIVLCRIKRKQNNREIMGFESESIEARDIGDIIGELATKSCSYSEVNSLLETSH
ncbi:PREDICTED: NAC domain-containing protein 101-like [Ipomoea nil]|uniref:NAC domain-containing protein 101-like n=1 Tax=Ipomoea nil TaxID=35883 RepID=UPI000900B91C|nr:PREDICTED: NAC domain-containing protein 101-like [Ipomoea nil]